MELSTFYLNTNEPSRSCLLALRDIILAQDENVSETIKYGMPCFCYKNKMFCFLWTDKKTHEPYILMVEGKHLNYSQLESGNRTRTKILRVNSNQDIPIDLIRSILKSAIDLYKNGTIKTK
ncbi:DUF1801 domain-containing protein [Labilibacter marinus]|uniref:DUF1801 domain-containing protein n=1 Tax=Labilibacter marinus TaxID=1477105 RepID=UPI00082E6D4F|nr:DUF1801 domain-containing protein [Labilibacter marinus]